MNFKGRNAKTTEGITNILFVTPSFPPSNEAASARAKSFTDVFMQQPNFKIHLLALKPPSSCPRTAFRLATNKSPFIIRFLRELTTGLELFFRLLFGRYDFVLLSSPPFFSILMGAGAAVLRGKPFALDVRDLYPHVLVYQNIISTNGLPYKLLLRLSKFVHQKAQLISTVTHGLRKEIHKAFDVEDHKILLIQNGFDHNAFKPADLLPDLPLKVVMHGTLGRFQDIENFLRLADALLTLRADVEFHIYGAGPKEVLLTSPPSNVHFHGELSAEKIPALLRSFHLGISYRTDDELSRNSFPVKCFEYIGAALPVISSPISEAGTTIESLGIGWQVDGKDVNSVAKLILKLSKNPTLLQDTRSSIAKVRNEFSRETQSLKLVKAIQERLI